jgi:hypothetical protein
VLVARRSIFAPGADESAQRAWRFLLAAIATSLVFFSLSSGKRSLYLLPIYPATALLCADALLRWLGGRTRLPRAFGLASAGVLALLLAVGAEAIAAGLGRPFVLSESRVGELRLPFLLAFGCGLVGVAVAGLAAGLVWIRNRLPATLFPGLAAATVAAVELAAFLMLLPALEPTQSLRPTAEAAARLTPEGQRIGLLGSNASLGGINYYGRRRVAVLSTPEDAERFFAEGGRALIVKRKGVPRLTTPVEIVHSARTGRRELVVVTPHTASEAPTPRLD